MKQFKSSEPQHQSAPDVSVIITTYNRLWALPAAVGSCRDNDCATEIVVVDDGSTDGTWEWLQSQPDVVAIRTDNWGKCWAANAGFAASTGEFVRFLDSDDWLLPHANDRQLEVARETGAKLIVGKHIYLSDKTGARREVSFVPSADFLSQYIEQASAGCVPSYCACLIHRSLVCDIPHRQEYPLHDIMLMLEIALDGPAVAGCDWPCLVIREHDLDKRLSDSAGFAQAAKVWGDIAMFMKVVEIVRLRDGFSGSTKEALLRALWREARKLARWDMREAKSLIAWVCDQEASFDPPVRRGVSNLYGILGFVMTERIAAIRTSALGVPKSLQKSSPIER